ncbi:MAG: nucleotidyltransferase domain-containing protein [Candidatus Nanoarchaeia archaeon]|nr:nucleotidyltransferase domain-containing protein [Candidatus Nanoarchaeia archaeon]
MVNSTSTILSERYLNLEKIKTSLINSFGSRILSAIVYGSTLNEDFCQYSDYDILLVVDFPDVEFLKRLKEIKETYLKENIKIDFNTHSKEDIPAIRKELFWHNNRGVYVQKEFDLYGTLLIGENLFKSNCVDKGDMLREAVRVINSLNYQARKLLVNKDMTICENKILMMKWCIYASLYALASRGIYPSTKQLALKTFYEVFKSPINPETFLKLKINNSETISDEDIEQAYSFLNYLDTKIYADYKIYVR